MIALYRDLSNESNTKQQQSNKVYLLYIYIYKGYSALVALLLEKVVFPYSVGNKRKWKKEKVDHLTYDDMKDFIYTQNSSNKATEISTSANNEVYKQKKLLLDCCLLLLLLLKKWCKPALDILREETDRNVSDSEINQVITQYYDHTQYKTIWHLGTPKNSATLFRVRR